jgi:hypothetical protein
MSGDFKFVRQTQNVGYQNFLGYYTEIAYGMLI